MAQLENLIRSVFAPQPGENIVILNDFPLNTDSVDAAALRDYEERRRMAESWRNAALSLTDELCIIAEPTITYEPTGAASAPLPIAAMQDGIRIDLPGKLASLGEKDIVLAITRYSATGPLFGLMNEHRVRGASMPGATMDMTGFNANYPIVNEKAVILAERLTMAEQAKVRFLVNNGEYECIFDLRGRTGHADGGICRKPGQGINLPAGEGFIAPYEGFDPLLGDSQTNGLLPVIYNNELVVYRVKKGIITEIIGDGLKAEDMRAFFDADSARRFIAELGLGCNDWATLCGKVLQDEKVPGLHWAYGLNSHLGGMIDRTRFHNQQTVHDDIVYPATGPVTVALLTLRYPDASSEVMLRNGKYSPALGEVFRQSYP